MVTRARRPTKPPAKRKASYLQVRVTEAQGRIFGAAAELAGLDKSAWVRDRLLIVARGELRLGGVGIDSVTGKRCKPPSAG
jgi:hypothetical protein